MLIIIVKRKYILIEAKFNHYYQTGLKTGFSRDAQKRILNKKPLYSVSCTQNSLVDLTHNKVLVKRSNIQFKGLKYTAEELENINKIDAYINMNIDKLLYSMEEAVCKYENADKKDIYDPIQVKKYLTERFFNTETQEFLAFFQQITNNQMIQILPEENFNVFLNLSKDQYKLTKKQKKKLEKNFNFAVNKALLKCCTVEILNYLKSNIKDPQIRQDFSSRAKEYENKILKIGLSPKVKKHVNNAEKNLNVKLNLPDDEEFAKFIYENLDFYNKLGLPLPNELHFNNFDFFVKNFNSSIAFYVRFDPQTDNLFVKKYCQDNEKINERNIFYNPADLIKSLDKNDYTDIYEKLRHEIGHFWHNQAMGDRDYDANKSFKTILDPEERVFLNGLKALFVPFEYSSRPYDVSLNDFIDGLKSTIDHKDDYGCGSIFDEDILNKANTIINKLENVKNLVNENFKEFPDVIPYALTNTHELVATAIQFNNRKEYTSEFKIFLKKLGMPDIKDRSYISR